MINYLRRRIQSDGADPHRRDSMFSLKKIIISRLQRTAILLAVLVLPIAAFLQVFMLQNEARDNAHAAFQQIRQILDENTRELANVEAEYRQTCLLNAESIAYMIRCNPEILNDIEEFHRIAIMLEVDEIHIFDKTGRIFTGTHPEYYGFTFETGEQIGFFAPMLKDKTLRLCQDITPNTAEGKLVQYSALWSEDQEFIVQVGMYPATVLEYTEKNELSYIFSLLQGSPGVSLYAIDAQTGLIQGSTSGADNGKRMEDIGLKMALVPQYKMGTQATVNGVDSFSVFADMDGTLIAYVISNDTLYSNMALYTLLLAACLGLMVVAVVVLMWRYTRRYIIKSIDMVNEALSAVADGNLEERVDVRSSLEFTELSEHINDMILSLLSSTDKMGFVLDHTNLRIGVYEYSTKMKSVRFTERIPEILEWDAKTAVQLSSDYHLLQRYFDRILNNPVPDEKNIYRLDGKEEKYIKWEEIVNGPDTMGIIIDKTEELLTRWQIEKERDIDLLTGLYNRRAMESQMSTIFSQDPGYGAVIMIDADSLKIINDRYGHTMGDRYLRRIAEEISRIGQARSMAARLGGDEFVLLLYGCSSEAQVYQDLEELRNVQKNTRLLMENGKKIEVRFSFGYVMCAGRRDYYAMLSEADGHMYEVKRMRKRTEQIQ